MAPAAPAGPIAMPFPARARSPAPPSDREEPTRRTLERARAVLAPRGIEADYVSRVGDPAAMLLRAADEHDAELIVVGSRAHGFLERLLGGATDERLARTSGRDVLLVH